MISNYFLKILFFNLFLILLFTGNGLFAQRKYMVSFGEQKKEIFTTGINGNEYIKADDISNNFFLISRYNQKSFTLNIDRAALIFNPSSCYIAYKSKDITRAFQMRNPAIYKNNNLYIPFNSFCVSLEIFNICQVELKDNKIELVNLVNGLGTDYNFENVNYVSISTGNEEESLKPNVYILPPALDRPELNVKNSAFEKKDIVELMDTSNLITTNLTKKNDGIPSIIKIFAVHKEDYTEIHFQTDLTIKEFQKAECSGKNMLIRFPMVQNTVNDFSGLYKIFPISSVKFEKVRHFTIFKFVMKDLLKQCTSRRVSPNEIAYSIYPTNTKGYADTSNESSETGNELKTSDDTKLIHELQLDREKKKWNLDVIVLDPGHGGFDAGAIGVTGVYEKDVTLKLVLKVKELLKQEMPDTKVVLTRSDDRFIELYKRGQIANQAQGKLFISIHLNAAAKKPSAPKGFETYILRPGRNEDAIEVANKENAVIKFEKQTDNYKKLTNEDVIIATMAQSSFVRFSELFARLIQEEVGKTTNLEDRGVKQAGFFVLVGASMPNVLFEASFLTNTEDERFANSETGQNKIVRGIVNAIKKYAAEYGKY